MYMLHVQIYADMYAYTCIYILNIYIYKSVCARVCVCEYVLACVCVCMHMCVDVCLCVCTLHACVVCVCVKESLQNITNKRVIGKHNKASDRYSEHSKREYHEPHKDSWDWPDWGLTLEAFPPRGRGSAECPKNDKRRVRRGSREQKHTEHTNQFE